MTGLIYIYIYIWSNFGPPHFLPIYGQGAPQWPGQTREAWVAGLLGANPTYHSHKTWA
jgi:hypothetical protein